MRIAATEAGDACEQTNAAHNPTGVSLFENQFFSITNCRGALQIKALGVAGNHGEVTITPATAEQMFEAVSSPAISEVRALIRDPWGIGPERPCLYRNDLIGWSDDEDEYQHPIQSTPPCQLYLEATFPGRGRIYFGEVHQEAVQIASFLSMRGTLIDLFTARSSPQARAAAKERASIISAAAVRSFLPPSGFCWTCDQDVTPYLSGETYITSCPLCWRSWDD
ncbi:hypothetical protein C405_20994 [Stenotrophomonas maltophilia AU12-09]|jgi:hypothetical protein|nr:hypothetical protein C405_20994 [Stenotrophomonas maltophilia AU12-09]